MSHDRWIVLEPLDTVAIRDSRAFTTNIQPTHTPALPQPTTVAGAIGAAFGANPAEVRGPVVVRRSRTGWRPLFPVPRDLVADRASGGWSVLVPEVGDRVAVEHDLDEQITLPSGSGNPVIGWWTADAMRAYLADHHADLPAIAEAKQALSTNVPWSAERRVGLARTAERVAADGYLYTIEHLRPHADIGLAARCMEAPTAAPAATVRFGGEGRRALVHVCEDDQPVLPDHPNDFPGGRVLVYLATPAVFVDGWRLDANDLGVRCELVSAAVDGPHVVATSSVDPRTGALQRSRLMWAAAAGSVYYLRCDSPGEAMALAQRWHGCALPQAEDVLRTAGFGLTLIGRW
jgi:CRISPR-associated protein Cmr3